MPVFGIDVSDFQAGLIPDVASGNVQRQGFDFIVPKCTEGSTWVSQTYPKFLDASKSSGMLFGAYHFLHKGNAAGQAKNYAAHCVDKSIPVMIDLEAGGATLEDANAFRTAVRKLGVTHCLLYLPHWYWQQIGSPGLKSWEGRLVSSAYPSSRHEYASRLYAGQGNGIGWQPYGGVTPSIWQFASTVKIDGYSGNVDGDAFAGTLDELRSQIPFKDFSSHVKPAPKPKPKPQKKPRTVTLLGWNCWQGNSSANIDDALTRWGDKYHFDVALIQEARTHHGVLRNWCKAHGFTVYQAPAGPTLRGGVVNEQGDSAMLVRDGLALSRHRVAKMRKRWEDEKHKRTHSPRESEVGTIKGLAKRVRVRGDHLATRGEHGPNKAAWTEQARRIRHWLRLGLLSASISVGDYNEQKPRVAEFFGKRFWVAGNGIDLLVARGVKNVKVTQLDKGGSDTHHGQIYTVTL